MSLYERFFSYLILSYRILFQLIRCKMLINALNNEKTKQIKNVHFLFMLSKVLHIYFFIISSQALQSNYTHQL